MRRKSKNRCLNMDDIRGPERIKKYRDGLVYPRVSAPQDNSIKTPVPEQPSHEPRYKKSSRISTTVKKLKAKYSYFNHHYEITRRGSHVFMLAIILFSVFYEFYLPLSQQTSYKISDKAETLLAQPMDSYAKKLSYDSANQTYEYNRDYKPTGAEVSGQVSGPKFSASFGADPKSGIVVHDPNSNTDVTMTPKYLLGDPKKVDNRLVYPLLGHNAINVYTLKSVSVKEDIILNQYQGDTLSFPYKLTTPNGTEARMENNGSIGIYGVNSALLGSVTTASDKDSQLLDKARKNGQKNDLLFTIPAPFIKEYGKHATNTGTHFTLSGDTLTVNVSGLHNATYPLTIDPSIYIKKATQFMQGNNESNVDFDVSDQLIQKGKTTGARFNSWNCSTHALNTATWDAGTTVAGGYMYSVGGQEIYKDVYSCPGSLGFNVPTGVSSITVKFWGGAGAGGAGGSSGTGAAGGAGGYVTASIPVSAGESLSLNVGGAGSAGAYTANGGGGGGGGGYTGIFRGNTALAIAAGGAGGGGGQGNKSGAAGGAGGGTSGVAGTASGAAGGGGAAGSGSGGTAGTGGTNAGAAGVSLTGGAGGNTTGGVSGGVGGGGAGGLQTTALGGGGGGGGGYYGGGGGSGSSGSTGGGGGGGGSSYTDAGDSSVTNTAGSGTTPGNSGDADRNGAGSGGAAGAAAAAGSVGTAGVAVISYTISAATTATSTHVYWSQFDTSTYDVGSPNPGNGTCSNWCTNSAYDLPAARKAFSIVAYNGYLYVLGGYNGSGTRQTTVYIAKLGANGEPQLWHPTDPNKTNWVYWYSDTALSTERTYSAAAAYNNRLYLLGGQTNGSTGGVTTSEYANIKPIGTLGTWTSTTALPSARFGHTTTIYNDRIYLIGGNSSGTLQATVYYSKISGVDGSLGAWQSTTGFTTARMTWGGSFTAVWGAYIYLAGGCSAVNGSGYCTTIASDIQLASINADGSLAEWNTVLSLTSQRQGFGLVAWRSVIYRVGGCTAQDPSTGACTAALNSIDYGIINNDGDASTVAVSVASGSAPCSGGSPYNCNLPGTTYIGNLLTESAISNGYLYIVGGCTNNGCTTTTGNVAFVALGSDGSLQKPAACTGGTYRDSFCVDSTHTISGGVAAASLVAFQSRIYVIGGLDGSANTGNISYVSLNNDGSLSGAWTTQTMTGAGATSVAYTFAYSRANPASIATNPGNLYIFGGCSVTSGPSCSTQTQNVYKCNIQTAGAIAGCTTTSQLQIGTPTGASGAGLGAHAGTVYANYIYLVGGLAPGLSDLKTVRYAKFDNSNNVVAVSGGAWIESANQTQIGRRRGSEFGYNGYIYVVGGYDGTGGGGVLADIEFAKVNVSDGSIGTFSSSAVTINQRWGLNVLVSNSYAYVIGGCTVGAAPSSCTTRTDTIQTFQIYNNNSGVVAAYNAGNTLGVDRIGGSSTISNGYIYYAGGCTAIDCSVITATTYYAPIDAYGIVGSWSSGGALPAARAWGKLLNAGGTLYYVGGQTGAATTTAVSTIYYTSSFSSGNPTWSGSAATKGIGDTGAGAQARTQIGATVWSNRIYITGGFNASGTAQATVYSSPDQSAGGNITSNWNAATSFTTARGGTTAISYANNLYIFGGYDGTNYLNDVQYAQITASTGAVGSWTYTTGLTSALRDADGFAANGYMYLVGGRTASTTCNPNTLVAPISANTTIASGNNPTGIGEWYETNVRYTGDRYGAAVSYADGKLYMIGGGCSAYVASGDRMYYGALKSQPQIAKYSRMIDTDLDVTPTYWLMNGLDNSIGATWNMIYRSSTAANSAWGNQTTYGAVSLGKVGTYTPIDGTGANTSVARYYYLNVYIDSSQAFGYPDDVSRGPTITDLSLFYTSNPSERLRHGKTFTGGLQQPLDTPCGQTVDANCPHP